MTATPRAALVKTRRANTTVPVLVVSFAILFWLWFLIIRSDAPYRRDEVAESEIMLPTSVLNTAIGKAVIDFNQSGIPTAKQKEFSDQINRDIYQIEEALNPFQCDLAIKVKREVERPGQRLIPGTVWSGWFINNDALTSIEIRSDHVLQGTLRFYLASAWLDRSAPKAHKLMRYGIPHFLTAKDGFDKEALKYATDLGILDLSKEIDAALLKTKVSYRNQVRGTAWATTYFLSQKQKLKPLQMLDLKQDKLPNAKALEDFLKDLSSK